MKTKRPLKNISDVRRTAQAPRRDPLPLVRDYQQKAIDASVRKVRAVKPGAGKTITLDHAPSPLGLPEVGQPFSIPIGDKTYVAAEITEEIAEQMVAEALALAGKTLSAEDTEKAVTSFVETGAFWKRQEERDRARREAQSDPIKANAAGVGYSGPAMPDKGKQDGSCNRTACQMPLAGERQYFMRDHSTTGGRLHYCGKCADDFTKWDRIDSPGQPFRCAELTPENRA